MRVAVLNGVVKVGLIEKVAFEQRLEGRRVSHVGIWEKGVLGRGIRHCKGSEEVMSLACFRNSKKASMAGVE